jgi:hypothetical protein
MEFKIKGKKITEKERDYLFNLGFKWCSYCKQPKEISNFSLSSSVVDGYCAICRDCAKNKRLKNHEAYKKKDAERYRNKHEELIEKAAIYRSTHQGQIKELRDKYYQENREIILAKGERYRQDNLDKIKTQQKEYSRINRVKKSLKCKEYRQNNSEKINAYMRNRYKNNDEYRLRMVCREMVRRMFDAIDTKKNQKTNEILGYTPLELKAHIEKQFKEGMSWDNYGEWHIDHAVPISYNLYGHWRIS